MRTSAASPWKARSACWAALKTATAPAAAGLDTCTDPDQAVEFAERTGVDALAIAIGTSHGAYKFTKKPDGSVLKMDVLIADPQAPAAHAPGDARQFFGAQGPCRTSSTSTAAS